MADHRATPLALARTLITLFLATGVAAAEPIDLYGPSLDPAIDEPATSTASAPTDQPATPSAEPATQQATSPATEQAKPQPPPQEQRPLGSAPPERAGRRGTPNQNSEDTEDSPENKPSGWFSGGTPRTVIALSAVIALAIILKFGVKRLAGLSSGLSSQLGAAGRSPSGVLEVLGRYPISRGQTLVLLRLDRRIVLLSQTPAGFATLSEVSDPDEVASILMKARDDEGASLAARFNTLLREVEQDPATAAEPFEKAGTPTTPRIARAFPTAAPSQNSHAAPIGLVQPQTLEDARPLTGAESLRRRLGTLKDMVA